MENPPTVIDPTLPASLDVEPIGYTEFDDAYDRQVKELPAQVRLIVEKLAFQISKEGLSLDEACLLKNIDPEWLEATMEKYPIMARIFAKKDLEYKVQLYKPINKKAKTDDRMAMYLLDKREPKQRKGVPGSPDNSTDMLAAAIEHIQENGDSSPLVNRSITRAVVIGKGSGANRLMEKVKALLPKNVLS